MNAYLVYGAMFLFGGDVYCIIELLYRQRTHYSMFFCAGFAMLIMYGLYSNNRSISPLLFAVIASVVITCLEFIFGVVVNLALGMSVWDYSRVPMNLYGQICLPFSLIWLVFGFVIYGVFRVIKV